MIELKKKVIEWGNSAGIYVPREYLGRTAVIQIEESPKLSERYVYGIHISMECYGYPLLRPDTFAPELKSEHLLKGYNIYNYNREEIKIMLPEDIFIDLLTANQDFRLIKGVPIMLMNYKKEIDLEYLNNRLKNTNKQMFLGYLLEISILLFKKYQKRKDLIKHFSNYLKNIPIAKNPTFLSQELETIYKKTEHPERIESTKQDTLLRKWHLAYFPKMKEFEEAFVIYATN